MIYIGDALKYLARCEKSRTMFADIPDNIGLIYRGYCDNRPDYLPWVFELVKAARDKCGIFWLSYNARYAFRIPAMFDVLYSGWHLKQLIWRFTFGQYQEKGFTSGYRPLIVATRYGVELNYNAIRTISERMRMGDSRARGLRVPDDVWEYPRIVQPNVERREWHPTQHPLDLMKRIALLSNTQDNEGRSTPIGEFCDLFLGSGTSMLACQDLAIPFIGVEISEFYALSCQTMSNMKLVKL